MTDELVVVEHSLPEFFKVKLGNIEYEMTTESLIVSMTHQFVSKNTSYHNIENYDAVFTVTKSEIEDFLLSKTLSGENFIDITIKAKDKDYIINFKDPIVNDEKLLNEYIQSLTWEDVKHYAEELKRPQPEPNYEKEWADCTKTIVQWEDTIDILDFLELDDKIYEEEEDDD